MSSYHTIENRIPKYMDLAGDLWYAAGGITVVTKSTFNVALGLTETPLVLTHDQFIYAMNQENHYEAAMLYEALIYLTDEATYIEHQLNKNFRRKSSPRALMPLIDATTVAYDMVVYDVYPKSRAGYGARTNWYTISAQRPSKILNPIEINKRAIEDMRNRLWAIVSQTQPWGTRGYQRDLPEAKNRMKYLVNESVTNIESAANDAKRGKFIDAAVSLTHAIYMIGLYSKYRWVLTGKMASKEFEEIDMIALNAFETDYNAIKDSIGLA